MYCGEIRPTAANADLPAQPLDGLGRLGDLDPRPVQLDDQHGAGTGRVAAAHGRLGGLDRQPVHHLDRGRQHPGGDHRGDRLAGRVGALEGGQQRAYVLRAAGELDRDLGGHPERALGADERPDQVVAHRVGDLPAEADAVPVAGDDLKAGDVVHGEAVLQAVRPAGVLRDVAADRADLLAGGVRGVVVAGRLDGLAHVRVDHPGLQHRAGVVVVQLDDRVHPRGHHEHALGQRQRPAGQAGAGAAGDVRDAGAQTLADRDVDVVGGLGEHDQPGRGAQVTEPVALVRPQLRALGDDLRGAGAARQGASPEPVAEQLGEGVQPGGHEQT
jgi:hypothetical protein